MNRTLYASVTGCSDLLSIQTEAGYSMLSANAVVECATSTLSMGDAISIDLGYDDDHSAIFSGFVKKINRTTPDGVIQITANDVLVRAVDNFLAADDPENPLTYHSIDDRDLVNSLLGECGLSLSSGGVSPTFTFGTNEDGAKFNLQSVAEAIQFVCNVTGRLCWAVGSSIYYEDRKPYKVAGDTVIGTWTVGEGEQIINISKEADNSKIRDRIVVYGKTPLRSSAEDASPYTVVRQTAAIAHELLDTQEICDATAAVNLELLKGLPITWTIDLMGDSSILPRTIYHIDETFTISNNDVFVYKVSHNFSNSGFITSVVATTSI
jgi:hypothetical protein